MILIRKSLHEGEAEAVCLKIVSSPLPSPSRLLINLMKAEEKRVQNICLQWSSGASKKKNKRTTELQIRIDTLNHRYSNYLITASDLLTGFSFLVAKKCDPVRRKLI